MPEAPAPDGWLGGRLTLRQPARGEGHRAGTDALLLAAAATPPDGALVYDVGAATGAAGLALAMRVPETRVMLLERDPGLVEMAQENIRENGLGARVAVAQADLLDPPARLRAAGLEAGVADLVITNPPYLDPGRHRLSAVPARAQAHALAAGDLAGWLKACARFAKPKGRLVTIHRADALAECLAALPSGVGAVRVLPIHPRAGEAAVRILLACTRGSRAPLEILPGLVLHDDAGGFMPRIEAIQRGEAALDL